jgi:hypothetical protein
VIGIKAGDPGVDFGRVHHLAGGGLGTGGGDHLGLVVLQALVGGG